MLRDQITSVQNKLDKHTTQTYQLMNKTKQAEKDNKNGAISNMQKQHHPDTNSTFSAFEISSPREDCDEKNSKINPEELLRRARAVLYDDSLDLVKSKLENAKEYDINSLSSDNSTLKAHQLDDQPLGDLVNVEFVHISLKDKKPTTPKSTTKHPIITSPRRSAKSTERRVGVKIQNNSHAEDSKKEKNTRMLIDKPLLEEKLKQLSMKIAEVESQAHKLEKTVLQSENKENELKKEKDKKIEELQTKIRLVSTESEKIKDENIRTKNKIESIENVLRQEKEMHELTIAKLSNLKTEITGEHSALMEKYNKDVEDSNSSRDSVNRSISELQNQIDLMQQKEREKEKELIHHATILQNSQEKVDFCNQELQSIDISRLDEQSASLFSKIGQLYQQDLDNSLLLSKIRESHKVEVDCIKNEEEYKVLLKQNGSRKTEMQNKLRNIKENLARVQTELTVKEDENEQLRVAFFKHKESESEYIREEKRRVQNLQRFITVKTREIQDIEAYLNRLVEINNKFSEFDTIQSKLFDFEFEVLSSEAKRLDKGWREKFVSMTSEMIKLVEDLDQEEVSCEQLDVTFDTGLIFAFERLEKQLLEAKHKQILVEAENVAFTAFRADMNLAKSKMDQMKKMKEQIRLAESSQLVSHEQINSLHEEYIVLIRDTYQLWKTIFKNSQVVYNSEQVKDFERMEQELIDSIPCLNKGRLLLLETSAEVVVAKRKRLAKVVELIEKNEFDADCKRHLIDKWKSLFSLYNKEFVTKHKEDQEKRVKHIEQISLQVKQEKERLESIKASINSNDISEREQNVKTMSESERQRLTGFAELVSTKEEMINALTEDKRLAELELAQFVKVEKDLEAKLADNKSVFESYLEQHYSSVKEQSVILEASQRMATIRKLVEKHMELEAVLQRAKIRFLELKSTGTDTIIDKKNILATLAENYNQLKASKAIFNSSTAISKQIREELKNSISSREALEKTLSELIAQDKYKSEMLYSEFQSLEKKKQQLETALIQINQQLEKNRAHFESYILPLEKEFEENRQMLSQLNKVAQQKKKDASKLKIDLENIESQFNAQISSMRVNRQQVKHRLELKLKAIENMKGQINNPDEKTIIAVMSSPVKEDPSNSGSSASFVTTSVNASSNNNIKRPQSTKAKQHSTIIINTNEQHSSAKQQQLPATSNAGYFNMYIRKKVDVKDKELLEALHEDGEDAIHIISDQANLEEEEDQNGIDHFNTLISPQKVQRNIGIILNQKNLRIFGPQSKVLSAQQMKSVIDLIVFMRYGTVLQKRREQFEKGKSNFVSRHVYLSQEFTRLEIKDKRKKLPESFIKIEHITKVQTASKHNPTEGFTFSLLLRDKKVDFATFEEEEYKQWMEGINMLVANHQNLFYLRYNLKDLFGQTQQPSADD